MPVCERKQVALPNVEIAHEIGFVGELLFRECHGEMVLQGHSGAMPSFVIQESTALLAPD
jgi:hypothetical protein